MMQSVLLVGLGGFFGAICRYGLSLYVKEHFKGGFPLATLLVNVVGCFFLGVILTYILNRSANGQILSPMITIGFFGALTTFSTFGYETLLLLQQGKSNMAFANIALNMIVGLIAVMIGQLIATSFWPPISTTVL